MSKFKLMVVDDNPDVLEVLGISLPSFGYSVETFESAEQALLLPPKRLRKIDGLLTDFHMPGMNGLALAEQMKMIQPKIHVVIMSGKSHQIPRSALKFGRIIQKPFSLKSLADAFSAQPLEIQLCNRSA